MRASHDSIDNKQKMCEKVSKDITFIQFFHSTRLHSTELFKIFFSLLTLQLLFCKKLVSREKIDNYNKILDDNFNKHLPKNNKNNENKLLNTLEYFDNLLKQSKDNNDIDKIKNVFKLLSKKDETNFDNFKKSDNENKYKNKYEFDNDVDIMK